MREIVRRLFCVCALACVTLVLWADPALASDADCPPAACTFFGGVLQPGFSIPFTQIHAANLTWTGVFSENVYLSGSIYTYVFDLQLTTITPTNSLIGESTGAGLSAGDFFDSLLNFGVVFAGGGGLLPATSAGVNDAFFTFGGATLQTNGLNMNAPGKTYEFYAQSAGAPILGQFNVQGGGTTTTTKAFDPDPPGLPEPGSIMLFGTGLLMLGVILHRRLRISPK